MSGFPVSHEIMFSWTEEKIFQDYKGDMPSLSSVAPSPKSIACDLTYIPTILTVETQQTEIHS